MLSGELHAQPLATIPFLGRRLPVSLHRTPLTHERVYEKDGRILVQLPLAIARSELAQVTKDRIGRWLKSQAHLIFHERVATLNQGFGFQVRSITIKDMKSRWGSCSVGGRLNLNWRMVLAPLPVLDYLVVHELSHLKEMNHSARFWELVRGGCPDYRSHVLWLKTCGQEIMDWSPKPVFSAVPVP